MQSVNLVRAGLPNVISHKWKVVLIYTAAWKTNKQANKKYDKTRRIRFKTDPKK